VTDTFAEGLKMYAFSFGDISVVTSFFSLSPLFLLIASPLLTGDPLTWTCIAAVLLVVSGSLIMVYRPSPHTWAAQKVGILLALGASCFFALNSCFDRLAIKGQEGTPVFAGFAMTLLSATFLLPTVLFRRDRLQALRTFGQDFWLRGLLETAFMVGKLWALRFLDAPEVVALQRCSILLSIVAGRVLFREEDFGKRLVAGTFILAGVLLVVLSNL